MLRREAVKVLMVAPALAPTVAAGLAGRWADAPTPASRGTILMLYSTKEGQTRRIVEFMAGVARDAGHAVEVADLAHRRGPEAGAPDALLLAASIHMGRHDAEVARWVQANAPLLAATPSAFVSVSLSAAQESKRADAHRYVEELLSETGWQPTVTGVVAGALRYTHYGFIKRTMMRRIAADGGLPTDTSMDHEFTDWDAVRRLTENLVRLAPATVADGMRRRP